MQCPSCKTIYGEKTGTQPRGKMEVFRFQVALPGHEDCGTILIVYNIPHGIQVRGPPWIFLESVPLPVACPLVTVRMPGLPSSGSQEPGGPSAGGCNKFLGLWKERGGPQPFPEIRRTSWRQRHLSWTCMGQKTKCISRSNPCAECPAEPTGRNLPGAEHGAGRCQQ